MLTYLYLLATTIVMNEARDLVAESIVQLILTGKGRTLVEMIERLPHNADAIKDAVDYLVQKKGLEGSLTKDGSQDIVYNITQPFADIISEVNAGQTLRYHTR
jgi:hypothetical protein